MKRIQRKRKRGWRMPVNTIYVGRPTQWGNYSNNLADFEIYASQKIKTNPAWLMPLRGKDLACWCSMDVPCHADILLRIIGDKS